MLRSGRSAIPNDRREASVLFKGHSHTVRGFVHRGQGHVSGRHCVDERRAADRSTTGGRRRFMHERDQVGCRWARKQPQRRRLFRAAVSHTRSVESLPMVGLPSSLGLFVNPSLNVPDCFRVFRLGSPVRTGCPVLESRPALVADTLHRCRPRADPIPLVSKKSI
jgi:hypothetical protein